MKRLDDYDEIKRELEIMKVSFLIFFFDVNFSNSLQYVEFSGFDANEEDTDLSKGLLSLPSPNAHKTTGKEGKSLETLFATKNKRLQEELTKLRVCCLSI